MSFATPTLVQAVTCNGIFDPKKDTHTIQANYRQVATGRKGSLFYSAKADAAGKTLDAFVAGRTMAIEMFAFGLTRREDDNVYVEDLVPPLQDKIFMVDGVLLFEGEKMFADMLSGSEGLELRAGWDDLYIQSTTGEILRIPDFYWPIMRPLLAQACGCNIAETYSEMMEQAKTPIQLHTDWEVVISGKTVLTTEHYFKRVQAEADAQGLGTDFNMHYHPCLDFFVRHLQDRPLVHKIDYMNSHLSPSLNDLRSMDATGVEWFEIRSLGTVDDLRSDEATSRFYNMKEIREQKGTIADAIEQLFVVEPDEAQEHRTYSEFIQSWLKLKNLAREEILKYALGETRYKQIKAHTNDPNRSKRNPVLDQWFR